MKNVQFIETESVELKQKYTDTLSKEFVAFLNTNGGIIYIGVNDDGKVIGISNLDETMQKVSNVVTDQVLPNPQEFIDISAIKVEAKWVIKIDVEKGKSLYYIKKYGRSASGCFERIGTTSRSMTEEQIENRYIKTLRMPKISIVSLLSPRFDLTFNELKMLLTIQKIHFTDDSFNENFKLFTPENKFNYLAFLLSDQNDTSIKVCKFKGNTKAEFISRKEFKQGCLLRQMQEAYEYSENVINLVYTDVTGGKNRIDTRLYDSESFKEAWFNAVCHNLWIEKIPPAIYAFDDRVEIISQGALREDLCLEDFYKGISKPVNKELADLMLKLHFMEQSGKGTSLIINRYGKDVYIFGKSYMQCILKYPRIIDLSKTEENKEKFGTKEESSEEKFGTKEESSEKKFGIKEESSKTIINLLKENPHYSAVQLAEQLNITSRAVEKQIAVLKKQSIIKRIGSNKTGYWQIIK